MSVREEVNEAIRQAMDNPIEDATIEGQPITEWLRPYLWSIDLSRRLTPQMKMQINKSFQDWMSGGDGFGPWRD